MLTPAERLDADDFSGLTIHDSAELFAAVLDQLDMRHAQIRHVGLPLVTQRAIVATTPCRLCDQPAGYKCRSRKPTKGVKVCGPHGVRIFDWHAAGLPVRP